MANACQQHSVLLRHATSQTCPVTMVIQKINDLNVNGGNRGLSIVCGDLRHFFHQRPLGKDIQPFFGLILGRRRKCMRDRARAFLWRTLPMGWSYSPAIAQGIAWQFLAFRFPHERAYITLDGLENSPMFVPRIPSRTHLKMLLQHLRTEQRGLSHSKA